jgi:hypothetical protein
MMAPNVDKLVGGEVDSVDKGDRVEDGSPINLFQIYPLLF